MICIDFGVALCVYCLVRPLLSTAYPCSTSVLAHIYFYDAIYCNLFEITGPLVGIEKQIKGGIDFIDPDDLGDYISGKCSCDRTESIM